MVFMFAPRLVICLCRFIVVRTGPACIVKLRYLMGKRLSATVATLDHARACLAKHMLSYESISDIEVGQASGRPLSSSAAQFGVFIRGVPA
jgi:hypothetical protein